MSDPLTGYVALVRVRFNECDPLGHVNNAVYLNYLEQVAIDHAASAGWDSAALTNLASAVFVARKHEITYHQPAYDKDWLLIRTWPTDFHGARGIRHYTISRYSGEVACWQDRAVSYEELPQIDRGDLIITAQTEWAFMNIETGRPTRVPAEVIDGFFPPQSR